MRSWTMNFTFSATKGDIDPKKLGDACAAAAIALGLEEGTIQPGARLKYSSVRPKRKTTSRR